MILKINFAIVNFNFSISLCGEKRRDCIRSIYAKALMSTVMGGNIGNIAVGTQTKMENQNNDRSESSAIGRVDESPRLFKLTIDCFNELLDYLLPKDLFTLSQTCKTMQQVVGVYAKENYSVVAELNQITFNRKLFARNGIELKETSGLNQFIRYINISDKNIKLLHYIELHQHEFISVDHLRVERIDLNSNADRLRNIFHQLKVLQIEQCIWQGDFYDGVLQYCMKLERLMVCDYGSDIMKRSGNDWLLKIYPSLEHLELTGPSMMFNVNELAGFFALNSHVRSFSISYKLLSPNRIEFNESGIQLDVLKVKEMEIFISGTAIARVNKIIHQLNELYDRSIFGRLHLFLQNNKREFIKQMACVKGLEKLCMSDVYDNCNSPFLPNLKDFGIAGSSQLYDAEPWACRFDNLQRLYLCTSSYPAMRSFIRYSPRLKEIVVKVIANFNGIIRKISKLNKEREKLKNAVKVTIWVPDEIFVSNKWIATHGNLNLNLVEIRRSDSYRWDHLYDF